MKESPADAREATFSPADDLLLSLQRTLRLVPRDGFGVKRRIALLVAVTWVPIMAWAIASGHLSTASPGDSLLRHLGVHVRCLLAIPLLLMSEPLAHRVLGNIVANFVPSGLVRPDDRSRFAEVLKSIARLQHSKVAWAVIAVVVLASTLLGSRSAMLEDADALVWNAAGTSPEFGASWALYVVRPLFLFMLLTWLWRLLLTGLLFRRLAKLGLRLVPSHPDRVGGLGFVEHYPSAFSLMALAMSCVVSAQAAHRILAHGAKFAEFQPLLLSFVVLLAVLILLPASAFARPLQQARWRAKFQYGALAGRHFDLVHARWAEGRPVKDDPILDAPELGPAADVATLHGLGTHLRAVPIGRSTLVAVLLPALAPVLLVLALDIPISEILLKLLQAIA